MTHDTMQAKTCTKCGVTFPATAEYWHRDKKGKHGLRSQCKECVAQYQEANRDKITESKRQYYQANREKEAKRRRKYGEANREKEAVRKRQYQEANRGKIAEQRRQYREANHEKIAERGRQYREANPERLRVKNHRARARKQGLPNTFTSEQWLQCLEYFNYCCPVCDSQLRDLFGNIEPHADHWIPITYEGADNPGTVAQNMICLCNGCNLSKSDKMPDVWLKQKYGARKAKQISARIEAYFGWCEDAA